MYADDLVVIAETEDDLIKKLNKWKDNVENRGLRVNMNKTRVVISGEHQKQMQKAIRWPCDRCDVISVVEVLVVHVIQYNVLVVRSGYTRQRIWREVVRKDYQALKLSREDAMDHGRWKKLIKDG